MFWGWTDDLAAYKERKRKEKQAWEKKHPYKAKFNRCKDFISGLVFFIIVISWFVLLPLYGVYSILT